MLKKTCSVLLLAVILFTAVSAAFAIEEFPGSTRDIGGYTLAVQVKKVGNEIRGCASVQYVGDATISMTVKLQKKSDGKWSTVSTKSGGRETYARCDYAKGTYRVRVDWSVKDSTGKVYKMTTKTSKEKTFN